MLKILADNRNPNSLAARLRKDRFSIFLSLLSRVSQPISILDVGGSEEFWKRLLFECEMDIRVTLLNINEQKVSTPNVDSVIGNALDLNYENASVDVIFSNSVIEHVGDFQNQRKMADEVKRVAKRYFIQTPNKYFFIEPHFLFPFFQFLPMAIRIWLVTHFALGWFDRQPNPESARQLINCTHLLRKNDLRALFPGCYLYEEKILGMTKSFVAYSGWENI